MKKLLVFLWLLASAHVFPQLKGVALLPGQTDHSGIKFKFIAASTTAATDSVFTASTGAFSINISNGLYKVVITKKGYRTSRLNNNSAFMLTNTTVLDTVLMSTGQTINVGNQVYGVWETANTYVLTSDVAIPADSTLYIEPGTKVLAGGNFGITAYGRLFINGDQEEKILFSTADQNPTPSSWKGITFFAEGTVNHCVIEYCGNPITINGSIVNVKSSELRYFSGNGISNNGLGGEIAGNKIHDYQGQDAHAVSGTNLSVRCNQIFNGSLGVSSRRSLFADNNLVYGINQGYAFSTSEEGQAILLNNVIRNCATGIQIGTDTSRDFSADIQKNTIYNNHTGISITGTNTTWIRENIVVTNNLGIVQTDAVSQPSISHCIVWNNSDSDYQNVNRQAIGLKINTNINGDSVDAYFNLSQDPLFWFAPFTSTNSPAVKGGFSIGPGAEPGNIGAYPNECPVMQLILGVNENPREMQHLKAWPNPVDHVLTVEIPFPQNSVLFEIYDPAGTLHYTETQNPQERAIINLQHLPPGIYLLKVSGDQTTGFFKIVKQ